jgi:hypothetical protein
MTTKRALGETTSKGETQSKGETRILSGMTNKQTKKQNKTATFGGSRFSGFGGFL